MEIGNRGTFTGLDTHEQCKNIRLRGKDFFLDGYLNIPEGATGLVIFPFLSSAERNSPRNQFLSEYFAGSGLGTFLFDLLSPQEEAIDHHTRHLRFDIGFLSDRLVAGIEWASSVEEVQHLKIGLLGSNTAASACLVAAGRMPQRVRAVVSHGGRPDLAETSLPYVLAPTLLMVDTASVTEEIWYLNERALENLVQAKRKKLDIISGGQNFLKQNDTFERVIQFSQDWFMTYLTP